METQRRQAGGGGVGRTTPIKSTITHIPNYPKKLIIYQLAASSFWWVRYYSNGKVFRKSTKETEKRKAISVAKKFFDDVTIGNHAATPHAIKEITYFADCAQAMLTAQKDKVKREEITKITHENDEWRLKKHVLPHFGKLKLTEVDYFCVERFLATLSKEKLSAATVNAYIGLVRKVLSYGQLRGAITALPRLPKVKREDEPRGWFTTQEYKTLASRAKRLTNKVYEVRSVIVKDDDGKERKTLQTVKATARKKPGTQVRRITITPDLHNIIVFMVNSFIRPTDLKHLQHKHVEVIETEDTHYLRLSLPKSKKHDAPIVTMRYAVKVYLRQKALYEESKLAGKNDYVFMPKQPKRDVALTELQKQMAIVLDDCGLRKGPRDEDRSLYSLRHTCIMYRLLYGEGLDLLTLARNARTSPEMIDRFYARHLSAEMNIGLLQSKRRRKLAEAATDEAEE
jgi:hypothetical protein